MGRKLKVRFHYRLTHAKKKTLVQQFSVKYTGSDGLKPCVVFYVSTAAVQVKFYKLIHV